MMGPRGCDLVLETHQNAFAIPGELHVRLRRIVIGASGFAIVAFFILVLVWRAPIAPVALRTGFAPALVTKGAQLAAIGDCAICHAGQNGQAYAGGTALQTPFGQVYASNITPDEATGIGTWSEAAFRRAMRAGVDRSGGFLYPAFPYTHFTHVTDADLEALYAFLMTRQPVTAKTPETKLPFPFDIRPLMAGWNLLFLDRSPLRPDPAKNAAWNRGHYLVEGLGHCQACHSPHNNVGAEQSRDAFAGGLADGWQGPGLTAATSPAAIAWTEDAIYAYLRHGIDQIVPTVPRGILRGIDDRHAAAAGPMGSVSHDLAGVP
jgi:mono/diheme cytochrome c family protein